MMWSCSEALLYGAILLTSFPNSDALASSLLRGAAQRDSNDGTEATPTALPTITTTTPNAPTFPYPYPDYRYTTWQSLDNATKSIAQDARGLRYEENTWNLPYTAPVEMLSWESLRKEQLAGVQIIGFVEEVEAEEVWDCFQNHYEDYDWSELVQCNLSEYFGVLGWTKASWNGEAPPPASENSKWANLTTTEQDAAGRICFFNYTWDGVNIMDWTDLDSIVSNTTTERLVLLLIQLPLTTLSLALVQSKC